MSGAARRTHTAVKSPPSTQGSRLARPDFLRFAGASPDLLDPSNEIREPAIGPHRERRPVPPEGEERQRDARGAWRYSAGGSPVADLRTRLRITRLGEKPQLKPKASPGWVAWMLLPHTVDWYEANTSTVPVRA
jgi:hypothetical protein